MRVAASPLIVAVPRTTEPLLKVTVPDGPAPTLANVAVRGTVSPMVWAPALAVSDGVVAVLDTSTVIPGVVALLSLALWFASPL